ncbi:hypothetical protein [Lysinibacillus xylanilyticus]|uniref:hypothetical protein n=1 Tax=Lysinibacillus xylanilyticus TaxID=582475 RepID=UPI003CFCB386
MGKISLGHFLVGGRFIFYDYASEVSDNSDEQLQLVEQEEVETIYFYEDQYCIS